MSSIEHVCEHVETGSLAWWRFPAEERERMREASPWEVALVWPSARDAPEADDTVLLCQADEARIRLRVLEVAERDVFVERMGAQGVVASYETAPRAERARMRIVTCTMWEVEQPPMKSLPLTFTRLEGFEVT